MHQIRFRLRLRPRPRWRVYSAPKSPQLDLRGLLLRREDGSRGKRREERVPALRWYGPRMVNPALRVNSSRYRNTFHVTQQSDVSSLLSSNFVVISLSLQRTCALKRQRPLDRYCNCHCNRGTCIAPPTRRPRPIPLKRGIIRRKLLLHVFTHKLSHRALHWYQKW